MRVMILRLALLLALLFSLPATAAELKLASWNIAWLTLRSAELPGDVTPRDAGDLGLLAGYAKRLGADILALQEVDGPQAAARILDPDRYAFFFPAEDDVQRTGFAVRHGLRVRQNPDLAALDLRPRARFSLRRGTDITVETASGPLRLLSVHLVAGCRDATLSQPVDKCESLARQTAILAGWVAARQREGVAFAILGDFNRAIAGPQDELLRALTAEAPLTRATEGFSDPCWASPRGARRFIDHILLGGPARQWLVPESLRVLVYEERDPRMRARLSDHCPLSVRLR
ncbi:hydrolase [Siccirubricoccus deserti]|uniref:Endonuclease/exonuclease/phosphatase family protein n=1 Tax=Siccirubricoccus deserti TaxID=2013562 RepID=A0A9X0R035_9PROT|nr:endonuclease/exonuclease/phosphatase family protein [Siccirubricoccus deserti]MBC4016328.1 endonuclease/exonuclease/phosphatase family protein [Siccirubricoccus deserti]GGC47062.1 hydrolase [Siccirubricoccus deserti]